MKKLVILLILMLILGLLTGCSPSPSVQIAATTGPIFDFTSAICQNTNLTVGQLVTENISCLHDYTLQVSQMRMLENAEAVVISGAGLEDFLADALQSKPVIDSSRDVHAHAGSHEGHEHDQDPHIWLSPENAIQMAGNIYIGLSEQYPQYQDVFSANLEALVNQLNALDAYGQDTLSHLACRDLITFHDGFSYFAEHFDLNVLLAVEEESGSEASAAELKELIRLARQYKLPAVFTEKNGSCSAAGVVQAETGAAVYALDMGLSGSSYFDTMYHNIDTIKEALG